MDFPAWHELIGWGLAVALIGAGWIAGNPDPASRIQEPRSIAPNPAQGAAEPGEADRHAA